MLDAFIIEELEQAEEERRWEPLPIMVPIEFEEEETKKEQSRPKGKVEIRF